jgi:DNA-binding transcriptional ArsR family regulator
MPLKKQKSPHQADTRGGPWLGIPHVVLKSDAFRHLPSFDRCVLLSIVLRFNGRNNGAIAVSYRQIAHDLDRKNQARIVDAIVTLFDHGLIAIAEEGQWIPRKARQYRLTWVSSGPEGRLAPTNEYLDWRPHMRKPKKTRTMHLVATGPETATSGVAVGSSACDEARSNGDGKLPISRSAAATG